MLQVQFTSSLLDLRAYNGLKQCNATLWTRYEPLLTIITPTKRRRRIYPFPSIHMHSLISGRCSMETYNSFKVSIHQEAGGELMGGFLI